MTLTLSKQELIDLTGKRVRVKQLRALDYMKIPYRLREDGSPVVFRHQLPDVTQPQSRVEPNFDHIRKRAA